MSTIGDRIKQLRTEKNLTQEEFGKIFGIVKSTVSMYESNKSTPDDELKKKLLIILTLLLIGLWVTPTSVTRPTK